jgi:hypothetical protein
VENESAFRLPPTRKLHGLRGVLSEKDIFNFKLKDAVTLIGFLSDELSCRAEGNQGRWFLRLIGRIRPRAILHPESRADYG